jgi:hypothetical protein
MVRIRIRTSFFDSRGNPVRHNLCRWWRWLVQLWWWHRIQGNAQRGWDVEKNTIYAFAGPPSVTFPPQPSPGILAILTGYAYETEPNKPIIMGKTKGRT